MLFGIGLPEMMVIAILGLIVFGPERLPDLAAKAAAGVRSLRAYTSRTLAELNVETSTVTKTISDLQSLTPRAIVSDVVSTVVADRPAAPRAATPSPVRPAAAAASDVRAVFDPDAT